jgi:DNA processing protein
MADVDSRSALVALNATLSLPRDAVCRLALGLDRWLGDGAASVSAELAPALGVMPGQLEHARRVVQRAETKARRECQKASEAGARILTLLDRDYPTPLLDLDLPPPVLYCRGRLPVGPAIAIVGSRRADPGGLEVAELFSERLAAAGLTIVSGFARGIDTAAHNGALNAAGGVTVAVLGSGLDISYPRANRRLAVRVAAQGAMLTEFPLGAQPLSRNFPVRNRIIAALALGTLVVQATPRSGSLITARLALDLGRDVFAIPGPIFQQRSMGTNTLIRDGALLAQHPRDILESLPLATREQLLAAEIDSAHPSPQHPGNAGTVLAALVPGLQLTADRLAEQAGLTAEQTLGALLELELAGRIRRCPGPSFVRRGDLSGSV